MKLNEDKLHSFVIRDQRSTIADISEIVEKYYDLGKAVEIRKLDMGDSNFNYSITLEKDHVKTQYFGQLYNAGKSLANVKFELALRAYFMRNMKSSMKCALHYSTKDGGYTVKCQCAENDRVRYFCLFDFLEGNSLDRDEWAYGKMSAELLKGCAKGIALYHIGAYGFTPPAECVDITTDYEEELAEYKRVFTEEFEKCRKGSTYAYYDYFAEYQPRLLELLNRYTKNYLAAKDKLPTCMCHMDTSPQNYLFNGDLQPIGICDLDWSQEHPRILDICWFINEGLCKFDSERVSNRLEIDDIVAFINAYDDAIEEAGNLKPGKLTKTERELLLDLFQLVTINCGFYIIWVYILEDNPSNTNEFNTFWGNWTKTALEFVETHYDEFKRKIVG